MGDSISRSNAHKSWATQNERDNREIISTVAHTPRLVTSPASLWRKIRRWALVDSRFTPRTCVIPVRPVYSARSHATSLISRLFNRLAPRSAPASTLFLVSWVKTGPGQPGLHNISANILSLYFPVPYSPPAKLCVTLVVYQPVGSYRTSFGVIAPEEQLACSTVSNNETKITRNAANNYPNLSSNYNETIRSTDWP